MNPIADRAKCEGNNCDSKKACGRYLRPSAERQVWSAYDLRATKDCGFFEPVAGIKITDVEKAA